MSKTVLTITYDEDPLRYHKYEFDMINQILNDAMGEIKSLMMTEIVDGINCITETEFEHYNMVGGINGE